MATGTQPADGQVISSYRIIQRLGAGGMGEVYQAFDTRLQRDVALTFLSKDFDKEEAQAACQLDHPNVGSIYGLEETESGEPFLVTAYYDGLTLAQRLQQGVLQNRVAAEIAHQIASGLAAAHAQHLIHRDIKPSNIILSSSGLVKIVDFGIAGTKGIGGTVDYRSPEQVEGRTLDARTDLWSLGAVLVEMLSGQQPFHRETDTATSYAILHASVPPLRLGITPPLQRVIYRALAKEPANRYQSAGEMMDDLKVLLDADAATVSAGQIERYRRSASAAAQPTSRWTWVLVVLALFVAVALLVPAARARLFPPPLPHLVALPLAASSDDQPLADGLMEALVNRLSKYENANPDLWIVPNAEVRRRRVVLPGEAQKALGANLVITGSLKRKIGNGWQVVLKLVDVSNASALRQLGSIEFNSTSAGLSRVEDQAVARLASFMHLKDAGGAARAAQNSSAYESYLKAIGYLQRFDQVENTDKAIALLQSAIQSDSNFPLAYSALAQAYLAKNSRTKDSAFLIEAGTQANRSLTLDRDLAAAHVVMGRVQHELGHEDLALEEFQRASGSEPRNADALFGLADVYQAEGRIVDAEATIRRAAALRPEYWEGYNRLGIFLQKQSRFEEAAVQFRRVIELTPDNASGYSNLGGDLIEEGKLSEALPPLEKAAQLAPSYAIYANLGILYTGQHQYQKAAEATKRALQMSDKDWRVWASLATIYRFLSDRRDAVTAYAQALPLFRQSLQLQPADAATQAEYAELMAFTGEGERAKQQLESALALAPLDPQVLKSGANVYDALGDRRTAVAFANKAVENGLTRARLETDPLSSWLKSDPSFKYPDQ